MFAPVDVEIKLDEDGYVLPASQNEEVYKRYMVLYLDINCLIVDFSASWPSHGISLQFLL